MALLVALVSILAFVLLSVSPVDPLQTNVGQAALGAMSPEQVERLKGYWGVDLPPAERYLSWAADVLRGDMGTSLLYRRPVAEVILEKLSNSLWLLASSWLLSGLLGFTLGVLAGRKRGGLCDRLVTGYSLLAASTPAFWTAMVLLMVFAVYFKWFPIGLSVPIGVTAEEIALGDRIRHAVLPAAALSLTGISSVGNVHRPPPRPPECADPCHDLAVCIHQRDHRRLCSGGAGIFLSGTGPGGSDSRTGKRRAPSSGDHSGHGGTGSFREPGGQRSLWNRGSQDPERSGPMSGMKKRENGKRLGNRRLFSMGLFGASVLFLLLVAVFGYVWQDAASVTDFSRKNLPPCAGYLFGTDWMGRDMFVRTVAGLSMSIRLGLLTAAVSAVIAFLLGLSAAVLGRAVDGLVTLLIDLVMGIPHMLLLILISFACGKGFWGVTLGIALTHWASLARLIRGEVFQLRESPYIRIAGKLGKSRAIIWHRIFCRSLSPG